MSTDDPIVSFQFRDAGPGPEVSEASSSGSAFPQARAVSFDRKELAAILNLYGRRVAQGDWRDYAIDFGRDSAVFSIFRRASEVPLYRIVKAPKLARKQGAYAVVAHGNMVLRRGHDLAQVLRVLIKKPELVTA